MENKKTITARNCGYLIQQEMQNRYGVLADKLQLQKLTYICFGYYGGATEEYLFDDIIEAWKYGPVIPSLYHQGVEEAPSSIEENIKITTNTVVLHYGKMSGNRLVSMTHSPGTPWSKVYKEEENIEIPKDSIISCYRPIMKGLGFMSESGLLDELART